MSSEIKELEKIDIIKFFCAIPIRYDGSGTGALKENSRFLIKRTVKNLEKAIQLEEEVKNAIES